MSEMRFTKDHEWIKVDGGTATVGITDYAQHALGDLVFVELPQPGRSLKQGDECAVVESVKAASEVYAPVSGTVSKANDRLADQPGLVNESPEDGAWFFTMTLADASELAALMDRAQYDEYVKGLE
jgi:glycine cleavage system H protein